MYKVNLTRRARQDLADICRSIERAGIPKRAIKATLRKIEGHISSLSENPERGSYPSELLEFGVKTYRQIIGTHPYRIIYRVKKRSVLVMLIADGRRDMKRILQRRLLL